MAVRPRAGGGAAAAVLEDETSFRESLHIVERPEHVRVSLSLARRFHESEPVPLADAVALGLISLAWALAVFAVRRLGIVDRISGAPEESA